MFALQSHNRRRLALLSVATLWCGPVLAGNTWDGGGSDNYWTNGRNWNPASGPFQIPPPNNGFADIHMAGIINTTTEVNIPYSINSLTFDAGSANFFIVGQELTIGAGGVTNFDNSGQFVAAPVKLAANQTWNAAAGALVMYVVNLNGFNLTMGGVGTYLNGPISGSGLLTFTSTVTMQGSSSNTYTNTTRVDHGTLVLNRSSGAVAIPGDLLIFAGTVELDANEQISQAAGNEVTLDFGYLNVNTQTETLARLVVNKGGLVEVAATGKLTAAEAVVTGEAAIWRNDGDLYIGDSANGTLEITNYGVVTSASGFIGDDTGVTGDVTVDGAESFWVNSGAIVVGNQGDGALNVTGGGRVSSSGGFSYIGNISDSTGEVTVDGMGSSWTNRYLYVGASGNGTLNITNKGQVASTGIGIIANGTDSISKVTVDGMGSRWAVDNVGNEGLYIGNGGDGALNVTGGGLVSSGNAYVAYNADSTGTVMVDGDGSTWTNSGNLFVGYSGDGALNVTGGGQVSSNNGYVARNATSTVTVMVDGDDSTWTNSGNLFVGDQGDGTLDITAGGVVTSTTGTVGFDTASIGTATVTGSDGQNNVSTWNNSAGSITVAKFSQDAELRIEAGGLVLSANGWIGYEANSNGVVTVTGSDENDNRSTWVNAFNLTVGNRGTGTLLIDNGGNVSNVFAYIADEAGSTGEVVVDGAESMFTNFGDLFVGNLGDGTLVITNGATTTAANVIVGSLGEIHGDGNIVGAVQNGGLVSPGMSPGALHIDEDYTQTAAGELLIELASASSYDQLLVIDNATLAGTLTVNLIDGFIPSVAQTFTILTADDVDGTFDLEMLPSVPNLEFDVIYNATSVVLAVLSALPGDYNRDGTVDAADYVVWRKGLGTIYTPDDFNIWRAHFGQTAGSGQGASAVSSNASVPEPATLVLLILATAGWCLRRAIPHSKSEKLINA